jgi:L-histidine N-alpha-methyltransferase
MIARELVAIPDYADEVVRGLSARPKTLPCKLFYDERGSALFEEITQLPEYYLTRTEFEILQERSSEIVQAAGSPISVVELGAGTATKTSTLLRAVSRRQIRVKYFPVDISPSALAEAKERVRQELPGALVHPLIADFGNGFRFLSEVPGRKFVLYLGSSIGNFDLEEATGLLRKVCEQLSEGDALLLGTDMVKSPRILVPAYDDAQGITAQFNKNILYRINRELDADFDLDSFRHVAEWNPQLSRMEIYLESTRAQSVVLRLTGAVVKFADGERIHTENSYKYTLEMVERMLCVSGFMLEKTWFDRREWFGLHLSRVGKIRNQISLSF